MLLFFEKRLFKSVQSFCSSSIFSLCFALINSSLFLSMYLLAKIKDDIPLVAITILHLKEEKKKQQQVRPQINMI